MSKKRSIIKNKKGFTLVELIVVVALMAVLVGTVTPSVYYTTARRQKSSAEFDLQSLYRNSIASITALSNQNVYPEAPYSRVGTYAKMSDTECSSVSGVATTQTNYYATYSRYNGWYIEYSRLIAKRLYQTITGLDLKVYYYNPVRSNDNNGLLIPDSSCTVASRSSFIAAGNKNPYVVIQAINTKTIDYSGFIYIIISYHNDKFPFKAPGTTAQLPAENANTFNAYENNADKPIVYTYKVRT